MKWRYPLVAFDLDGTLAQGAEFVWSLLHEGFGVDAERRAWARDAFFARQITYREWFATDLELLAAQGATRQGMLELFRRVTPTPGAREVLHQLRQEGRKLAILSGSVDLLLEHLFPGFAFDHVLINRLHFAADGTIAGGVPTAFDLERKADGLAELARREGLALAQCAFLGDHENDLAVLRAAGLGIAFNPRTPRVVAAADAAITELDLRLALPLLR